MAVQGTMKSGAKRLSARCFTAPNVALVLSFLICAVLAWWTFDRTPPLILYDGEIIPQQVRQGQTGVRVVWHARFSGRDCPGFTQRELTDSKHNLWPKRKRARGGIFHPSMSDPFVGIVTTPPLSIPSQMAIGKDANYRVTQFYYCNPLQRFLHWPIVQQSVKIPFVVLPKKEQ